jgi:hypothetical protein
MKTGDKRSTRKSLCCSRRGVSTRNFERTVTRYPMQVVIFTFREFEFPLKKLFACVTSLDKVVGIFCKFFEKTRRHEGIVPWVAPEQRACLSRCKDTGCSN